MHRFPSIQKLDTAILYLLELASSLSVLLLAFGLIASMANVLTKGSVLTNHAWAQEVWAWTQCIAIDASVAGAIIRTFQYRKEKQKVKMWLYAFLSVLLLFTAAIVSNIESVQQTLNIALDQAYAHVIVPVEFLIWVRSIAIVCLIVAHALRHVDLTESTQVNTLENTLPNVIIKIQEKENTDGGMLPTEAHALEKEQLPNSGEIPEASPQNVDNVESITPSQPKASLADLKKQEAQHNKQRVTDYLATKPDAKANDVSKALSLSLPTVRKHMQRIKEI